MSSLPFTEWRESIIIDRKLRRLEKEQRKADGRSLNWDYYEFQVSPTCPPSTSIIIRGGQAWHPSIWGGYLTYNPTTEFDLSDPSNTYPDFIVPNAYWYVPAGIGIYSGDFESGNPIRLIGDYYGDEDPDLGGVWLATNCGYSGGCLVMYEKAWQAERALDNCLNDAMAQSQLAVCKIILRNNGNTTETNQFLPVDRVNRGRSYLWGDIKQGYRMG